ncbi:MAG: hypothetical protein ACM3UZ_08070 [Acidobacteriota bacterium]
MKEPKKKLSPKRNEIIRRMASDINTGRAKFDAFAIRLDDKAKCSVCSRDGRNMVRLRYDDYDEFLGKTCARYVLDEMHAEGPMMQV